MTPLLSRQEQLERPGNAGIFRASFKDLPALKEAATALGLAYFSVDLHTAANVPGFIKALKRDLHFPDWFGDNLDALNDCLTDFSWHPAPGYVIAFNNIEMLRANPTSFAALNEVIACAVEEWQARNIPFWVFYVTEDSAPTQARP